MCRDVITNVAVYPFLAAKFLSLSLGIASRVTGTPSRGRPMTYNKQHTKQSPQNCSHIEPTIMLVVGIIQSWLRFGGGRRLGFAPSSVRRSDFGREFCRSCEARILPIADAFFGFQLVRPSGRNSWVARARALACICDRNRGVERRTHGRQVNIFSA